MVGLIYQDNSGVIRNFTRKRNVHYTKLPLPERNRIGKEKKRNGLSFRVSTRLGPVRNEVAEQSEGPIGTLKIGVKCATELDIF